MKQNKCILIINHDIVQVALIQDGLGNAPIKFLAVNNGEDGFKQLSRKRKNIDLIILNECTPWKEEREDNDHYQVLRKICGAIKSYGLFKKPVIIFGYCPSIRSDDELLDILYKNNLTNRRSHFIIAWPTDSERLCNGIQVLLGLKEPKKMYLLTGVESLTVILNRAVGNNVTPENLERFGIRKREVVNIWD